MTLTPNQIQELLDIISKNQNIALVKQLGPEFLSEADKELLDSYKVNWSRMYTLEGDMLYSSFHLGMLAEALGQTYADNLTYEQLKEYISKGKYIPLTVKEQVAINTIKSQTLNDLKRLNNRIFTDVNQILINNSLKAQQKFLKEEIAQGIADKKTITEIAHTIAEKTGDWSRDFEKIVAYNNHLALEEGKAAMIQRNSADNDPIVYKTVFEGACDHCIELYLTAGIGSQPRLFKLSELKANGTNIGRKTKDWLATLGPVHPYCFDDQTEVYTNEGWKLFKNLNRNEKFLSVNLETGDAEWIKAVNWVEHKYKGPMHSFENKNLSLVTSPNHHHVIRTRAAKKLRLVETLQLPTEAQFLKHIPNWIGSTPIYKFDNKEFDPVQFTKFLAFFFSEGSTIDYKGRLTIHISQSQHKYLDEIYGVCLSLFDSVSKCKDYVQIMCTFHEELWEWLNSFGKANVKRIPNQVKDSTRDLINTFLDGYCKGDGSFVKGREWDGYQCKDSRLFHTSSKLMADDLGELMLKIGKCPSYTFTEAQEIYDPKRGRSYMQNQGIWHINECTSKYVYKQTTEQRVIDYDGYIYDVELEKNHTLLIRRNGKVCVSGNCRCSLHELPNGWIWNKKVQKFLSPSELPIKPKPKRPLIHVWIGGEEKWV